MTSLTVERVLLLQPYLKHDGFNKKNEIKKALKRLQSIKNDSSRRVTNILGSGLASAPPSTTQWLYQRAVTWNSTVFRFRHQPYVYCGVLRTALLTNQLSSCIIFTWHGHRNLFLFECVQTMLNFQLHFSHFFHSKIRCGYEWSLSSAHQLSPTDVIWKHPIQTNRYLWSRLFTTNEQESLSAVRQGKHACREYTQGIYTDGYVRSSHSKMAPLTIKRYCICHKLKCVPTVQMATFTTTNPPLPASACYPMLCVALVASWTAD